LEYFRLDEVCKVELEGNRLITDEFGLVTFESFKVKWGPEGLYTFWLKTENKVKILSETIRTYVRSRVGKIIVKNDPLELGTKQKIGTPFSN